MPTTQIGLIEFLEARMEEGCKYGGSEPTHLLGQDVLQKVVDELESLRQDRDRLRAAFQVMCDQICSPKTTVDEMVANLLGEKKTGGTKGRASR